MSIENPGPTSIEGKAISSRNAVRHGCCADSTLILKTENAEDYKSLGAMYFKSYSPQSDHEKHLVQELTTQDWFYQRATRAVAEVEAEIYQAEPNAAKWMEQQQRTIGRFLRYQTTRANNVKRCQKAIEDYRKNRIAEKLSAEKLATAEVRRRVVERKNNPEPTWKEHLVGMRQKAIDLGYTPPDLMKK